MTIVSGFPSRPNFATLKIGGESTTAVLVKTKNAGTTITSSTTLTDDPDLFLPLVYPARYLVMAYLWFTEAAGASSGGIKYAMSFTGGAGGQIYSRYSVAQLGGGGVVTDIVAAAFGSGTISGARSVTAGTNDTTSLRVETVFLTTTAAGNIKLQWAQAASSIQGTTLNADSCLVAYRLG